MCYAKTLAAAVMALPLLSGCAEPAGTFNDAAISAPAGGASAAAMAIQAGKPQSTERARAMQASFEAAASNTIEFAFDSAQLDAVARETLAQQAAWLRAHPSAMLRLVGHADAPGTDAYNIRLGRSRAEAAARHLASLGVEPRRIIAVESRGARDLLYPTSAPNRLNRRVVSETTPLVATPRPVGPHDGVRAALVHDNYQALGNITTSASTSGE
jgi:outer membrane protein OmpA-like peptidoglycan-associated protein